MRSWGFLQSLSGGWFHYYSLVVDNSKMDHKRFNDGDKEIGFNKMLFRLLFQFARKYRSQPIFYAYLDHRATVHTPDRMRLMLNGRARKVLNVTHNPFRVCQFRNSEDVRLIQADPEGCSEGSHQRRAEPNFDAFRSSARGRCWGHRGGYRT